MTGARQPEPTREILNIEEAAQLLGVSTKTFAKVLREGQIPGRKIGREWKFSRGALIQWVGVGRSRDFFDAEDRGEPKNHQQEDGLMARPSASRRALRPDSEMSIEED